MENGIFSSSEFQDIMERHIESLISFLLENSQEFNIVTKIESSQFEPNLPEHIFDALDGLEMLSISNYSFESAKIKDNNLIFEAGFGEENFGTTVTIPLLDIKYVLIGEDLIAINVSTSRKRKVPAFLNNPENQDLINKKS